MPPSSWLRGVSLWRGEACGRREGSREEGGGEQGSEGGATTRRVGSGKCSETQEVGGVCSARKVVGGGGGGRVSIKVNQVQQGKVHSTKNTPRKTAKITRRKCELVFRNQ